MPRCAWRARRAVLLPPNGQPDTIRTLAARPDVAAFLHDRAGSSEGEVLGALYCDTLALRDAFQEEDLEIFTAIGSQAAMWLAFGLWLLKGAASGTVIPVRTLEWLAVYQWWWTRSSWLFVVAALLSACGIWLAGRREPRLPSVA